MSDAATKRWSQSRNLGRPLVLVLAVLLGFPIAAPAAAQDATQPGAAPAQDATPAEPKTAPPDPRRMLLPTPAEEDWSFLADPNARTEALDAIKYIPLGTSGAFVSLGGEGRVFVESYRNEDFGRIPGRDTYPKCRALFHADAHLSDTVRVFLSTQSSFITGRNGGPRPSVDRDELDLIEGFIEVHSREIDPDLKAPTLMFRVGRQLIDFGAGRLLSAREGPLGQGPNVSQAFDTVRLIGRGGPWRVDLFAAKPTDPRSSAWREPQFVDAIARTGRRKLVFAGISTDNCTLLTALDAMRAGYQVYFITDISGAESDLIERTAIERLVQAGATPITWVSFGSELLVGKGGWATPEGKQLSEVYTQHTLYFQQ